MSGGGGFNNIQMGQQGGFGGAPAPQQPTQPAYQSTGPNTGWNRAQFSVNPNTESLAQATWLRGPDGARATADMNARNQAAFNATQMPIDRNTFNKTRNVTMSYGDGGDYTTTENYFDQAGYDQALAAQKANTYKPMSNQEAFNQTLRDSIQAGMGNYGKLVQGANEYGASMADIQRAIGGGNDVYTYMNRPNYQQYSPNGQFNQPIYQSNYQNYNTGNPMAISQYGQGPDYYGMGLAQQMSTPFNPYTNSYQTPFSAQQAPTQPNYGPSQAIVSRSAGVRGTPNVVARRAEGGIASLMDDAE